MFQIVFKFMKNIDDVIFPEQAIVKFDRIIRNLLSCAFIIGIFIIVVAYFQLDIIADDAINYAIIIIFPYDSSVISDDLLRFRIIALLSTNCIKSVIT